MVRAPRKTRKAPKTTRPKRAVQRDKARRRPQVAWWLTADLEVCAVCSEGYAYGAGYRCSACDAAVCAFCIQDRSGELLCLEC